MKIKIQTLMKAKHPIPLLIGSLALFVTANLEAQTTPGAQPTICDRACWAARAPNCGVTTMTALTRAIVHHTAASSDWSTTSIETSKPKIRGVQNYHMDANGWCDIGYHFLFDKLGNIFEGRVNSTTTLRRGIHDACNANSFGFTLLGYFHPPYNHSPTPEMLNSYYNTIAWRMPAGWSPYGAGTYCNKTVGFLDGHKKVVSTACPGDNVHPNLITENYNGGPMRTGVAQRRTPGYVASSFMTPSATGNGTSPNPGTANNADGRLEVFGVGSTGSLWHVWENSNNGPWSSWANFGGSQYSQVVSGKHADGRLETFVIGANNAVFSYAIINGFWNGPASFPGAAVTSLTVGNSSDGRIEVFAAGTDGALWHLWETSNNGPWSSWQRFNETGITKVALGRHQDGRLEVFYTGAGGAVGAYGQNAAPGGAWSKSTTIPAGTMTSLAVANNSDGRLEIFGTGVNGALWHFFETANNGPWSGWQSFGESGLTQVVLWPHAGQRLEAFYIGSGGFGSYAIINNAWVKSTGMPQVSLSSLFAGSHQGGRIELVGRGTDGLMKRLSETSPNGAWTTSWESWPGSPSFK